MVVLNALSDRNPLHFDVGVRDARHNEHQVRARRRVGGGGSILISPLHVPPECAPSTTLSSLIPGVATLHTLELRASIEVLLRARDPRAQTACRAAIPLPDFHDDGSLAIHHRSARTGWSQGHGFRQEFHPVGWPDSQCRSPTPSHRRPAPAPR